MKEEKKEKESETDTPLIDLVEDLTSLFLIEIPFALLRAVKKTLCN